MATVAKTKGRSMPYVQRRMTLHVAVVVVRKCSTTTIGVVHQTITILPTLLNTAKILTTVRNVISILSVKVVGALRKNVCPRKRSTMLVVKTTSALLGCAIVPLVTAATSVVKIPSTATGGLPETANLPSTIALVI